MEALDIQNTTETLRITLDKRFFDETFVRDTIDYFRTEYLAQRADFDESIDELGEEIKRDWWQRNKSRLIQE